MKIAVMTGFPAKWNMNINARHIVLNFCKLAELKMAKIHEYTGLMLLMLCCLSLHTNGQNLGGPNRFIQSIDLTFSSGDGQSFHLASSVSPSLTNDFQHQFTYLSSGVFSPSILGSVSGVQLDASNANGFGQDVNLSSRLEVTAAVGSVPEPASTAMLVIGLTLLAASRRRRQADRVN